MPRIRDLNPNVLQGYEHQRLRIPWNIPMGLKGKVWSFTVFLPRLLITEEGEEETICTSLDEELLRDMLVRHFGGCTVSQNPIQGVGPTWQKTRNERAPYFHNTCLSLAWYLAVLYSLTQGAGSM